jgi:large conductance mechanosensitive channel
MLKDYQEFINRGNIIDLAVGVVIGAAFGAIVNSLVEDLLMPPIGMLLGGVDFKDLFFSLRGGSYRSLAEAKTAGEPVMAYGQFLNTVLKFLIISFAVFQLVRQVNRMRGPAPAAPVTNKECPQCLSAIPLGARRCAFCTSMV